MRKRAAGNQAADRRTRRAFAWILALFAVFLVGAAVRQFVFTLSGPGTTATVTHCETYVSTNHTDTYCVGRWTIAGRQQTGTIIGVSYGDIGRTIDVRVHEGAAYSPNLLPPIVLLILGIALSVATVFAFRTPANEVGSS